jgi:hypothetical protein
MPLPTGKRSSYFSAGTVGISPSKRFTRNIPRHNHMSSHNDLLFYFFCVLLWLLIFAVFTPEFNEMQNTVSGGIVRYFTTGG